MTGRRCAIVNFDLQDLFVGPLLLTTDYLLLTTDYLLLTTTDYSLLLTTHYSLLLAGVQ